MEPFFSVIFSAIFLGDVPPVPVLLTLVPIVGGVVIASREPPGREEGPWSAWGGDSVRRCGEGSGKGRG